VVIAASLIGLQEFYAFVEARKLACYKIPGLLLGGLLSLNCLLVMAFEKTALTDFTVTLILLSLLLFTLLTRRALVESIPALSSTLFGIFYVNWLFGHLTFLRGLPHGKQLIFYLLLVVWSGDTGAYYVGKSFGRHKLAPVISPKKTIEGSVGGTAASLLASYLAKLTFLPQLSYLDCALLGICMAIVAQLGDLCESLLKRSADIKDSGSMIPGHGGILDRMDGVMFAAPVLYYYAIVFVV
jgi:phosphatidate cytidylyltransferase